MGKDKKIIFEIYRRLYKAAEPSADFDELMKTDKRDSDGRIDIEYDNYHLSEDKQSNIIEDTLSDFKVKKYRRKDFRIAVNLGASPRYNKLEDKVSPLVN